MPAPTPETASALLTAESLIIAAMAIVTQRSALITEMLGERRNLVRGLSLAVGLLVAISFLLTLAILHIAQYPEVIVSSIASPRALFNGALLTLLLLVYLGLFATMIVYYQNMAQRIEAEATA